MIARLRGIQFHIKKTCFIIELYAQLDESAKLEKAIKANLKSLMAP